MSQKLQAIHLESRLASPDASRTSATDHSPAAHPNVRPAEKFHDVVSAAVKPRKVELKLAPNTVPKSKAFAVVEVYEALCNQSKAIRQIIKHVPLAAFGSLFQLCVLKGL